MKKEKEETEDQNKKSVTLSESYHDGFFFFKDRGLQELVLCPGMQEKRKC